MLLGLMWFYVAVYFCRWNLWLGIFGDSIRFSIRNFGIHLTENAASNGINIIIKSLLNESKEIIIYSISPEPNSIARICPLNDSTNDTKYPLIIIAREQRTHSSAMQLLLDAMRKTFTV